MKATFAFALLGLSALTQAVALPDPVANPEPWCRRRGQSCWKVKRAIEAFTDSLDTRDITSGPVDELAKRESHLPGGSAYMAKRALDGLATVISTTQDEGAQDFYDGLDIDEEDDTEESEEDLQKRWCIRRGQSCWKAKREVPEYEARDLVADKRWCARRGQSCWKAKRAATAVIEALETRDVEVEGLSKRSEDLEARWCMRRGQSCWKRSEDALAARDVHAIMNAARDVLEIV